MKITFAADRPADAAVLAFPVKKDAVESLAGFDSATQRLIQAAATGQRFDGEPGTTADAFVANGDGTTRIVLLGVGSGDDAAYERAGGALTARLLTSGATAATIDLSGTDASAIAVARLAAGAAQRAWRYDVYRTKLADKAKPTLAAVTIVGAPDGTDAAWVDRSATTEGIALTRTLVTLPPNILYPESFVEIVRKEVDGLGLEITVLDEAAMTELGMGALLGVSQGSRREAQLLALKWNGAGDGDSRGRTGR